MAGFLVVALRVSIVGDFATLAQRAPSLVIAAPGQDPFTTFGWYRNLYEAALARECSARLLLAESDAGQAVACLPMALQTVRHHALAVRRLSSLSNFYSSLFGPILPHDTVIGADVCGLFADTIRQARPSIDVVEMKPHDPDGTFHRRMRVALASKGFLAAEFLCFGNWYLPVQGQTFADYFAARPSALRNTILRKQKALQKQPGYSIVVEGEPGAALDRALVDFEHVYKRSWKMPEPYPDFIPALGRVLAAEGWLRLGVVRLNGQPIASQLWIVKDRRALIYKLAYDEEHARLSAGSVLTKVLFEHVMTQDGVAEIDYLTGDDAYKKDWMTHRRERYGLIAFNRSTLPGLMLAARHFAGRVGRAILGGRDTEAPHAPAGIGTGHPRMNRFFSGCAGSGNVGARRRAAGAPR